MCDNTSCYVCLTKGASPNIFSKTELRFKFRAVRFCSNEDFICSCSLVLFILIFNHIDSIALYILHGQFTDSINSGEMLLFIFVFLLRSQSV